jgi:hypothetical protein
MTDKNYKPAKYSVEIELAKSPDDVFDHIIDLSKWWPEEFEGRKHQTEQRVYIQNRRIRIIQKIKWLNLCRIKTGMACYRKYTQNRQLSMDRNKNDF